MMKNFAFISLAIYITIFSPMGYSASLTWNIQNASFNDGGRLTGWFTVDTSLNLLTDFDLTTTTGTSLPGFHYDLSSSHLFGMNTFGANPFSFVIVRSSVFAQPYLNLSFMQSFLVGGNIDLNTTPAGTNAHSWECNNCAPLRNLVSGTATTESAVPEPAVLALLGLGAAGMGLFARRRRA